MKKLLSIAVCLMFCFSSMLVLSACGEEKPKNLTEVQAAEVVAEATLQMDNATSVKIHFDNFLFFLGEMTIIETETVSYTEMGSFTEWVKKEGENWYSYSILTSLSESGETTEYMKKLIPVVENDNLEEALDFIETIEGATFKNASKLNGEVTASYGTVYEGQNLAITCVVSDGKFKSFKFSTGFLSMTMELDFGEYVINEIPSVPTNVDWFEYEPYIEVDGISEVFEVGDTLDLEDVIIEFYEDKYDIFPSEEFDATIDMVSGFNTTTATEDGQSRKMTITFCGLTYEIEYIVLEPMPVE